MVGLSGLEPPTSRLSGGRSNRLSYKPVSVSLCFESSLSLFLPFGFKAVKPRFTRLFAFGGDMRDRTADPLLAKQVLSQLSYTPISSSCDLLLAEIPFGISCSLSVDSSSPQKALLFGGPAIFNCKWSVFSSQLSVILSLTVYFYLPSIHLVKEQRFQVRNLTLDLKLFVFVPRNLTFVMSRFPALRFSSLNSHSRNLLRHLW